MAPARISKVRFGPGCYLLLVMAMVILGFVLPSFFLYLAVEVLISALFAMAVNLLLGNTGMTSFGQAAYFGLGAYTCALLVTKTHLSINIVFPVSLVGAGIVAAIFGLVLGFFAIRSHGIYFALLTLAFAQLVWAVMYSWYDFTQGDTGIPGVNPPDILMRSQAYYFFVVALVAICGVAMYRIHNSPFGWALRSIRENPTRAEFIGINVARYRLIVFIMSAFFSGIAGALFVYFLRYANPSYAGFVKSGEPLFAILVGGTQSFIGPAFGGVLLILLHWVINRVTEYWLLVMGAILVLVVLFFPEGMIGYLSKKFGAIER